MYIAQTDKQTNTKPAQVNKQTNKYSRPIENNILLPTRQNTTTMSATMRTQAREVSEPTTRHRPSAAGSEGPSHPRRVHIHGSLAKTVDWERYDRRADREARRFSDEEILVSLSTRNALALHGSLTSPLLSPASSTASDAPSASSRSSTSTTATSPSLSKA